MTRQRPRSSSTRYSVSRTAAVVVAAGRSERFSADSGGGPPKQFWSLGGRPLVLWSLDVLRAAELAQIVVAVPPGMTAQASALLGEGVQVVEGGETRQASVAAGLAHIDADAVLIHDGARPFIDRSLVSRVVRALENADAAVTGVPVDETLKSVDGDLLVIETVDRTSVWRVQTPQAFHYDTLVEAHRRAAKEGYVGTDDAELIELYGGSVAMVRGSRANIKITYPEDMALATSMIGSWPS